MPQTSKAKKNKIKKAKAAVLARVMKAKVSHAVSRRAGKSL